MVDVNSKDVDQMICYCTVSSPTLKRLTMRSSILFVVDHARSVTFDTPSLVYFEYFGILPQAYAVVNFDSLVEANLRLHPLISLCNPTNLLKSLRNVEILDLSSHRTMEEAILVFSKLHHLSIATKSNNCWQTLPVLLKNSPNLETLVIKGPLHCDEKEESDSECSCLSSCPVKVLEINLDKETILELNQLKHFLEKLQCLELVKVRSRATDQEKQMQLRDDILNLPRSSECMIQFEFIPPR